MEDNFALTRDGYDILKAELDRLMKLEAGYVAQSVDVSDDIDPSHEEAAETDGRVEHERNEERIGHLQLVLCDAKIVDDNDPATVDVGDRVTVYDMSARKLLKFDLRSSEEIVSGADGISVESPVGQALNKRRIGDVVTVDIPDGQAHYTIRDIVPISGK
jgi:transcription elongation factor GreA